MRKWAVSLRYFLYTLLALLYFCLQTLPNGVQLFGVDGELIVPLIVAVALYEGEKGACIFALLLGVMYDYASGQVFGVNTLFFMLIAYFIAILPNVLIRVSVISHSIISTICVFLQSFFGWLALIIAGQLSAAGDVFYVCIVKSGVSIFGGIVVYFTVKLIYKKLDRFKEKESFHY